MGCAHTCIRHASVVRQAERMAAGYGRVAPDDDVAAKKPLKQPRAPDGGESDEPPARKDGSRRKAHAVSQRPLDLDQD